MGSSAFVDSCVNENPFAAIEGNTGQERKVKGFKREIWWIEGQR